MIASKTKNMDTVAYFDTIEILESLIRSLSFVDDREKLITDIEEIKKNNDALKHKIETYDYTHDDLFLQKFDNMRKVKLFYVIHTPPLLIG